MNLINARIYVKKQQQFNTEAKDLLHELNENLNLNIKSLEIISLYDVFNIDQDDLNRACATVFTEAMVDELVASFDIDCQYLAIETLPGQYDQRADSAMQCVRLLNPLSKAHITTGKIYIFNSDLSNQDLQIIEKYLLNPIESRIKDLSKLEIDQNVDVLPLEQYIGFIDYDINQLLAFLKTQSLAMTIDDLKLVQAYFKSINRDPKETEIKVLDTYWSDHCRHTTFETCLENVVFTTSKFNQQIKDAYNRYLELRNLTKRDLKPQTLMDIATINGRYLRQCNKLPHVEISDEINACSVFIDVDHDGVLEKWLLQFKNETHNHPTEIEPFGGASTCIGGAIRDPLSGRSYVYQAMRLSGSGDITTPLNETIDGKLPQRIISKKSAHGNSSYGNQIGLATTFVKEIYHDDYVAKHMEVGAVVGAVKASAVRREKPNSGDVIILLGGKTGRDGIGGATGSSKEHNQESLDKCASEVQKGNAPEERKIQRLFRNPEVTKLIKKCNDFGAGGVCVAIGELADGLIIHLGNVRCKYAGLNATEIAISESQERMAVVVEAKDAEAFIKFAQSENLEAYQVAEVTDNNKLVMEFNGDIVVDIDREFLDTAGARQSVSVDINDDYIQNIQPSVELTKENVLATLHDQNVACQKGLVEMFDASIGSTTVLMPFGGKYQMTPSIASVQKLPVLDGKTNSCSILTYGFNPKLMMESCFTGAMFSVLDSMAKTVAIGGNLANTYFSFQEYFERLNKDDKKWGKVLEALLGAMSVQDYFELAAIGGKDSMSGTFKDINVPPTLISFACTHGSTKNIISNELKTTNSKLGVFIPKIENGLPDLASYKAMFDNVTNLIADKQVKASYVVEDGGILSALFKMSFGNKIGFNIESDLDLLKIIPGAIIVETQEALEMDGYHQLGQTCENNYVVNDLDFTFDEVLKAWLERNNEYYPIISHKENNDQVATLSYDASKRFTKANPKTDVNVCLPVFPGTNCEYDTKRAFEQHGATGHFVVFRNQSESDVEQSINDLVTCINNADILALSGGFSSGDEPDGSAKFIVNVLQNEKVKEAIDGLLKRDGLIIGICNGFQALIKSGLLPYGEIKTLNSDDATLFRNDINRHISLMAHTKVVSNNSPWLQDVPLNEDYMIAMSHGEGKFVCNETMLKELIDNGQIAFQYVNDDNMASNDPKHNPNGSTFAIEGIVSKCGKIIGKMGHSERYFEDVFINIPGNKKQNIFASGINYIKGRN